jgi:myosin heavy subunit
MKAKIGIIILIIVSLVLGIALINRNKTAEAQKVEDEKTISLHSNQLVKTSMELEEQKQVNRSLRENLDDTQGSLQQTSNTLNQTSASLAQTEAELKAAQEEMQRRDQKIAALENQNQQLDSQAIDLRASIQNLETSITDTQRKLEAAEGDRSFLEQELQRLMAEKAELERQFNDLEILRKQVAKLKEDLSIARRLDWIRRGIFTGGEVKKGAVKLMEGIKPPEPKATPNYDLNVEVSEDGTLRVIEPATRPETPGTNTVTP